METNKKQDGNQPTAATNAPMAGKRCEDWPVERLPHGDVVMKVDYANPYTADRTIAGVMTNAGWLTMRRLS